MPGLDLPVGGFRLHISFHQCPNFVERRMDMLFYQRRRAGSVSVGDGGNERLMICQ